MFRETGTFDMGGSHVAFLKKDRPPQTEDEKSIENGRRYLLNDTVIVLRKIKTDFFEQESQPQELLNTSHEICSQMADYIIKKQIDPSQDLSEHPLVAMKNTFKEHYKEKDWDSKYCNPASTVVYNLEKATDDILVRIEQNTGSLSEPDHQLNDAELKEVLREFLFEASLLSRSRTENLFSPTSKCGGILTGGMIYLEIAKQLVEKYGQNDFKLNTFAIAVDSNNKQVVCERTSGDDLVENVYILDDLISKGGTIIAAANQAGDYFERANIIDGVGTSDSPEERAQKRHEKVMLPLETMFYDYADAFDESKPELAYQILAEAEKYASENNVELQPGWYKRRDRMKAIFPGPDNV